MSQAPDWVLNGAGTVANTVAGSAGIDANNAQTMLNFFEQNRDYNNAWSASQARIQREWQEQQNAKAMAFNQSEAQKNRDWQEMMSNTAHQREMADLKAAGLNPILSAMNGNGASVTSGATASGVSSSGAAGQTDTSVSQMMLTLLSSFLDAQTRITEKSMTAINNLAVADKKGEYDQALEKLKHDNNIYMHDNYPQNWFGVATAILSALGINPGNSGWDEKATEGVAGFFNDMFDGANDGKDIGPDGKDSEGKRQYRTLADWIGYILTGKK